MREIKGVLDWLGIKSAFDFAAAPRLGRFLGFFVTGLMLLFGMLFLGMLAVVLSSLFAGKVTNSADEVVRNVGLAMAAIVGVPFLIWRSVIAQKQVNVAEQGQFTDRINKAVEGLGAEKTVKKDEKEWTEPNIEVRIGALYALERIMQDSERDHFTVVEILCTYIRQNAAHEVADVPEDLVNRQEWNTWRAENIRHPRLDVDVALKVLEGRAPDRQTKEKNKGFRLGLERSNLSGLNLSARRLNRVNLEDAILQGADLSFAKLQGAKLIGAKLQGANLREAKLQGANLLIAELQGADLSVAELQGANFRKAELQGADLSGAEFSKDTELRLANLEAAALRSLNFPDLPQFKEHIYQAFGDGSNTLPNNWDWPNHWPKHDLSQNDFYAEWKKYKADPAAYTPPPPPETDA